MSLSSSRPRHNSTDEARPGDDLEVMSSKEAGNRMTRSLPVAVAASVSASTASQLLAATAIAVYPLSF